MVLLRTGTERTIKYKQHIPVHMPTLPRFEPDLYKLLPVLFFDKYFSSNPIKNTCFFAYGPRIPEPESNLF